MSFFGKSFFSIRFKIILKVKFEDHSKSFLLRGLSKLCYSYFILRGRCKFLLVSLSRYSSTKLIFWPKLPKVVCKNRVISRELVFENMIWYSESTIFPFWLSNHYFMAFCVQGSNLWQNLVFFMYFWMVFGQYLDNTVWTILI